MLKNEQIEAVKAVIESGNLSSLHGKEVEKFENAVKEKIGCKYAVAVNSGTAALHLSLLSLGIGEGDEVILPAMTFLATASAVALVGATPVYADIEKGYYSLDPEDVRRKITYKTKAIIPVHLAGIPAKMKEIRKVAYDAYQDDKIIIIEDACQALGAKYDNQYVGSIGKVGCFSFYPSKIITTGEGGMLVTDDWNTYDYARMLRDHGRTYKEGPAYILGYNYRMTEIAGALGNVGMKHLDYLIGKYNRGYKTTVRECQLIAPTVPPKIPNTAEIAPTYVPMQYTNFVKLRKFYMPIYKMPLFRQDISLPNTERAYNRTLKIPLFR